MQTENKTTVEQDNVMRSLCKFVISEGREIALEIQAQFAECCM